MNDYTSDSKYTLSVSLNSEDILDKALEIFYKDPHVIGIAIGPRRVNNNIKPNELGLLVYVAQKLPKKDFNPAHSISDDLRNIDWVRLHDLDMPNASQVKDVTAKVRDFGDVCVMEDDGTFVKIKPDGSLWIDYLEPYRLFRTLHGDEYDFVTFFPSFVTVEY